MKIGIDARALQSHHRYRGIGMYLSNLLRGISLVDDKDQYYLFIESGKKPPDMQFGPRFKFKYVEVPQTPQKLITKIKISYKPLGWDLDQTAIDVFLQPNLQDGLPSGNFKKVSVVYDLIPSLFKDQYFPRQTKPRSWLVQTVLFHLYERLLRSYKKLDAVISISDSTKKDLLAFDNQLSRDKIKTIYLGVDAGELSGRPADWLPDKPYFLYVGSCDFRKNVAAIIDAFNATRRRGHDCSLVLIGEDIVRTPPENIRQSIANSPYRKDIITPGFVEEDKLKDVYQKATAFVFASLYEGFGLPPLEAMAAGSPVISYTNSSLQEVLGKAYLPANSSAGLATAMEKMLNLKLAERQKMINQGLQQSRKFSWRATALQTISLFEEVHGKNFNRR